MKICSCISEPETTEDTTECQIKSTGNQYLESPTEKYCSLLRNGCVDDWTWDDFGRSPEVRLFGSHRRTALFHPGWSNGTAGVRGNKPLDRSSVTFWEIESSHRVFGTSLMFGIGTRSAQLHFHSFTNLIGADSHSWGLSHKGVIWHGGVGVPFTKPFSENVPTVIGVLFDGPNGTLRFFKDGEDLGIAFSEMNKIQEPVFPLISSTAARSEMTLGRRRRSYKNLQDMCISVISRTIRSPSRASYLPVPDSVKIKIWTRTESLSESQ